MLSQAQVINKILSTKDYSIVTLNELNDKYFSNYKNEFNFIKNHHDLYNVVPDKLTFANTFPDFDLVDVNEPNTYLLDQLFNDYNREVIAIAFNKAKKMVEDDNTDKAISELLNSTESLRRGGVIQFVDLMKDTSRFEKYAEKLKGDKRTYASTGFPEIDEKLGGIDLENENMVIAGRPGQGKTQILLYIAAALAKQGLRVGIYEGEMTADKVGYRIDTFLGHINNTDLNRGSNSVKYTNEDTEAKYKFYQTQLANKNYGPIFVMTLEDAGGTVTVDTLRAFKERAKLNVLLVDQYSLMEDLNGGKQEFERVGNIAKDIKKLQVTLHMPIIAVAQMNRTKNEDEHNGSKVSYQDTNQIGLSDKIPQYATMVWMLERDKDNRRKLKINVVKSRDGGDFTSFQYDVDWNSGRFTYDVSGDNEEENKKTSNDYGDSNAATEK